MGLRDQIVEDLGDVPGQAAGRAEPGDRPVVGPELRAREEDEVEARLGIAGRAPVDQVVEKIRDDAGERPRLHAYGLTQPRTARVRSPARMITTAEGSDEG